MAAAVAGVAKRNRERTNSKIFSSTHGAVCRDTGNSNRLRGSRLRLRRGVIRCVHQNLFAFFQERRRDRRPIPDPCLQCQIRRRGRRPGSFSRARGTGPTFIRRTLFTLASMPLGARETSSKRTAATNSSQASRLEYAPRRAGRISPGRLQLSNRRARLSNLRRVG